MLFLLKTLVAIEFLIVVSLVTFRYLLAPQYRDIVTPKIAILALTTPVVALFCGNIYLFCAWLTAITAFNSRSRAELAATYVFLLPMVPILSVETAAGSLYLFAISAVSAMNLGALIGFAITPGGKSLAQPRYDVSILLMMAIFLFIYNRDAGLTAILRGLTVNLLDFAGPYLLVTRGLASRRDVERLLLRLALGAVLVAITACFQAQKHWVLFQVYYQALNIPIPIASWTMAMRAGLLRTGGSMLDYSSAGVFLAAALTLMPMLRPRFGRMGFWITVGILICGLLATQSRGAWIASIVGILFILSYRGQWGRLALLAGASVAAQFAFLVFAKSGRLAAIVGKTDEATGTVTYRKELLSQGLEQVRAHPLFGQSPNDLVVNMSALIQGQHIVDFVNSHLYVAMTAGIPLFLVWCGIWLFPVIVSWRRRHLPGADLLEAPAAIIVPVMVAIAATSIIDRNLTWPTIALALAGPCLALSRQRRAAPGGGTATPPARRIATQPLGMVARA
ncbi:MAG: O-antigen ligase family protein [Sphingomonas taxi]